MRSAIAYTGSWLHDPAQRTVFQSLCTEQKEVHSAYISCGNFLPDGKPNPDGASRETSLSLESGADIVFSLPVIAVLEGYDTAAFAVLTLCDRIPGISQIVVPSSGLSASLLEEISMFLFREPLDYQKQIRFLMNKGKNYLSARAEALDSFVSGAGEVLMHPLNSSAADLRLAAMRRYSSVKLKLIETGEGNVKDSSSETDRNGIPDWDARLADILSSFIKGMSEEELRSVSQMTPSLPWSVSEKLLSSKEEFLSCSSFSEMARFLEGGKLSATEIRRGLLMLLLGIRLPNLSIAGLDAFSPYVRVLGLTEEAERADLWKEALRTAEVPVIVQSEGKLYGAPLDQSRKRLAGFDTAADELWQQIMQ